VSRFVDPGAVSAALVGVGMAVTIGVSFLLVIPIEPVVWYLALPSGLVIGYYANSRSNRAGGAWTRVTANALLAGVATGATLAVFLIVVKALFFFADSGYRDASTGGSLDCRTGADCVYQRYLAEGQGDALEDAGVTDVDSFSALYWREQGTTALTVLLLTLLGGVGGGLAFGMTNRAPADASRRDEEELTSG
jgi:hypothetical protein